MFCTASETEGEVVHVKPPPPVIHNCPFKGGSFVVVICCLFWCQNSVKFHLTCVHNIISSVSVAVWQPFGK